MKKISSPSAAVVFSTVDLIQLPPLTPSLDMSYNGQAFQPHQLIFVDGIEFTLPPVIFQSIPRELVDPKSIKYAPPRKRGEVLENTSQCVYRDSHHGPTSPTYTSDMA